MDFREAAANASQQLVQSPAATQLPDVGASLCVPVGGGEARHKRYEYINLAIAIFSCTITMSGSFLLLAGGSFGVLGRLAGLFLLVVGFILLLTQRKLRSLQMIHYLRNREGSLLRNATAPTMALSIEDAATHKTTKLVPEDAGVALLDTEHERILVEGFQYRYVICGRDVTKLETLPIQGISGAFLSYRVGDASLDLALGMAGHGALDSLIQSFSPGATAREVSYKLRSALALDKPAPPPPPVPPQSTPPPIPDS